MGINGWHLYGLSQRETDRKGRQVFVLKEPSLSIKCPTPIEFFLLLLFCLYFYLFLPRLLSYKILIRLL